MSDEQTRMSRTTSRRPGIIGLMRGVVLVALAPALAFGAATGEIHQAVKKGDVQAVRALLAKDPKLVASQDKNGETPLHEAARRGHKEIAALLIANKADLNAHNNRVYWDSTPLMYAVVNGHKDMAELLLKSNADPNHQRRTWRVSALHDAVGQNNIEIVRLLLEHKANPNVLRWNKGGGAPIHQAKNEKMLKLLLAHGADVNAPNGAGHTVLYTAVRWNRQGQVKFLLSNHADPDAADRGGFTPLHIAAGRDDQFLGVVNQLLEGGADSNARTSAGVTPLHRAAQSGGPNILNALLTHKADLHAKTKAGQTALHFAARGNRRAPVVKLLLEAKLDPNARAGDGRTPLHEAARSGDRAVVGLLLENRADPAARDRRGRRPLHDAAGRGHAEAAKALLDSKADANARDSRGQTPLHLAAREGHKAVADVLVAAGADVNAPNEFNETPLFWAAALGHKEIAEALVKKGARPVSTFKAPGARPKSPAPKAALAEFVVGRLKMRKGLALDVGCGDGSLALEIARRTELFITCIDGDERTLAPARRVMDAAGAYGTHVVAKAGRLGTLAYPSNSANLILCGDEFASGLRGRNLKEVHRVLSPNGVAVIGQSAAGAAKGKRLTRNTLEGWLRAAGIKTYDVIAEDGIWARVTKRRPEGSDEWRYRSHDPGNSHGSNDRLVGGPLRAQWISGWRPGDSAASIVVGDGRVILASLAYTYRVGHQRSPVRTPTPYIQAIDAYTGIELWSRQTREELPYDRSQRNYGCIQVDIALVDDSLFLLGGRACYQFDAATGRSRNLFPIPEAAEPDKKDIWLYLSCVGDLLYGGVGPPTYIGASWALKYPRGITTAVFALDRKTGKLRWISEQGALTGSLAIGEGKLFFCDLDYGLRALNATTGKELWANKAPGFSKRTDIVRGIYYGGKYWLVYHPTTGRYIDHLKAGRRRAQRKLDPDSVRNARKLVAFSATDGRRLFECELGEAIAGVSFAGATAYGASQHHSKGYLSAVDAGTGKRKWRVKSYFKCTPIIAAANCVFARSSVARSLDVRAWEKTKDPKSLVWHDLYSYRPTCTYPGIPANGLLYIQGPGCNCPFPIRANAAMAPGKPAPRDTKDRLAKGPAYGQEIPASPDKHPWRTWRADARRSAVSSEPAPRDAAFAKRWSRKLSGKLAPVAAANGLVYVASADSSVSALDAGTGRLTWRYFGGGRANHSPWLWQGRLYFGDDDGRVHCLRADNGEVVWRFRAAPAGERVVAYGRYVSRWPVRGGVLLHDGTLYCSVGFFPTDGCLTYALDALTGEVRWEKAHRANSGFTPRGPMALASNRLYVPCGWGPPQQTKLDDEQHAFRRLRLTGAATQWARPDAISIAEPTNEVLMRGISTAYVHWRGNLITRTYNPTIPVVTKDTIYLRGRYLAAEKRAEFAVSANGSLFRKDSRWAPEIVRWRAWKGIPMTAILKAGETVFTGGSDKVFATRARDGKELWSAPVPGRATDLAFNGGRLLVVCEDGTLACFGAAPE